MGHHWTDEEVAALIAAYRAILLERQQTNGDTVRNYTLKETSLQIQTELATQGFQRDVGPINTKLRNLAVGYLSKVLPAHVNTELESSGIVDALCKTYRTKSTTTTSQPSSSHDVNIEEKNGGDGIDDAPLDHSNSDPDFNEEVAVDREEDDELENGLDLITAFKKGGQHKANSTPLTRKRNGSSTHTISKKRSAPNMDEILEIEKEITKRHLETRKLEHELEMKRIQLAHEQEMMRASSARLLSITLASFVAKHTGFDIQQVLDQDNTAVKTQEE